MHTDGLEAGENHPQRPPRIKHLAEQRIHAKAEFATAAKEIAATD